MILNVLIIIVFSLILIVGWDLLFGHKDEVQETDSEPQTETIIDGNDDEAVLGEESDEQTTSVEEEREEESARDTDEVENADEEEIIIEESDDPNVIKTVINPSWEPVGTVQTGDHVTQYDPNSVDWQEMVQAISYATGLEEDEMIIWFIGRGEVPNKDAVGTVSSSDESETYRVYIEWIDGQGWKPVKVEYLRENDKK